MKKVVFFVVVFNMVLIGYTQELLVAVSNFTARSGYSNEELENITELFAGILRETGEVRVLTRSQWGAILEEHEFQRGGLVDDNNIIDIGHALGATAVVTGTLIKLGNNNILNLSLLDVYSGEMLSTARRTFDSLDVFLDLLPTLASDIVKLLKGPSPLVGRWKVDGTSAIFVFKDDGTFEAQNCDFFSGFKLIETMRSEYSKPKGKVLGYKFSYYSFSGNLRGTYSHIANEVSVSAKFSGICRFKHTWHDFSGIETKEEGRINNIDANASFTYRLFDNNGLELGNCPYLLTDFTFSDTKTNEKYLTKLTKVK
jgi:hypothetical protein